MEDTNTSSVGAWVSDRLDTGSLPSTVIRGGPHGGHWVTRRPDLEMPFRCGWCRALSPDLGQVFGAALFDLAWGDPSDPVSYWRWADADRQTRHATKFEITRWVGDGGGPVVMTCRDGHKSVRDLGWIASRASEAAEGGYDSVHVGRNL